MPTLILALNLRTTAVSQYTDYDLAGACTDHAQQPWGAGPGGIVKLEEPDHDEEPINAWAEFATTDFGMEGQKRIRCALLGGKAEGDLLFSMACDDDDYQQFIQRIDKMDLSQVGAKCYGRRDQKGRYWKFKIANQNGDDFSVDSIAVLPVILRYKPARR